MYYLFNLVLPAAFITATTVLVFYLPPQSGEKVSLGVTVLLALTVFLLIVAETMPPQSESIPLIGNLSSQIYFIKTVTCLKSYNCNGDDFNSSESDFTFLIQKYSSYCVLSIVIHSSIFIKLWNLLFRVIFRSYHCALSNVYSMDSSYTQHSPQRGIW